MSNRYEIREQIGQGGLGAVYKAFDTQLQREVAMKRVLSTDRGTEEEVRSAAENLIAEAQTLSTLNHPNIITVFDVGQDEDGGFVVMELLKGETFDKTIERGVLTQEDFTEVVYQTMEALIAAQASNVIHRDIKPTNIMVVWQASGKFQLKILDFGLAKFSKAPSVQTMDQEDSVLGSIYFMAPEQFERGELDARTDIYQMGCVYYNALTGQYPFDGETAPQVMNAHLQHKVIPLDQIRPDLPPAICQWVMWLINRDMQHRPENAREALKRWPRNPDPAASPDPQDLPVEETPRVESAEVHVVRAEHGASAPPQLIVRGATGRTSPSAGAGSGRVATRSQGRATTGPASPSGRTGAITGSIGGGRPNLQRGGQDRSKPMLKWILFAGLGVVVAGWIAFGIARKVAYEGRKDRIAALAADDGPAPGITDVEIALEFIQDPETPASVRRSAAGVLGRATGQSNRQAILAALEKSEDESVQADLAGALADPGFEDAHPVILEAFREASSESNQIALLEAIREFAGQEELPLLVESLGNELGSDARDSLETTILATIRRSPRAKPLARDLLDRLATAKSSERRSLFKILGSLDGEEVREGIASIVQEGDDRDMLRDAVVAYLNWPNRNPFPEVEELARDSSDQLVKGTATKALVRLATLPGPATARERADGWKAAFTLNDNPGDARRLVSATIEYPSEAGLSLLRRWSKHKRFGNLAEGAVDTLQTSIDSVPEITAGTELKGNRARVLGGNQATIDPSTGALTSWTSPGTWFGWSFRAAEGGEFAIEVDQANPSDPPGDFLVYVGNNTLEGESQRTDSFGDFATVRLPGTVALEADQIYTLVLAAGRQIPERMMDIRAIRLARP